MGNKCGRSHMPSSPTASAYAPSLPSGLAVTPLPSASACSSGRVSKVWEVLGAGDDKVNGVYRLNGESDGVPAYLNDKGSGIRILRYRFRKTGAAYWFISSWNLTGPTVSDDDLYRTARSESAVPPEKWLDADSIGGSKPTVRGRRAPIVRLIEDRATSTPAAGDLAAGIRVKIQGLKAAPELNGRSARVLRFDNVAGRYIVDLEGDGGQKSLRRESLVPCHGLSSDWSREMYVVEGAGDKIANGVFLQSGTNDGVPQYMNADGVTLLRYRFATTKNAYWFLSFRDKDGIDKNDRDLYRSVAPSLSDRPPEDGWVAGGCSKPLVHGARPTPRVCLLTLDDDEEDKGDGTGSAAIDMSYPRYWSTPRTVAIHSSFSKQVSPSKQAWSEIEDLLKATYLDKRTRDRKGRAMPKSLILRNLLRVENSSSWYRYAARRGHTGRKHCDSLQVLYGGAPVLTAREGQELVADVNEFYLWHGTKPSAAMPIVTEGFRIDMAGANKGAMFGPGAYFAEASSKSDEYAEDDDEGIYAGLFAMLLCRVCCGRLHRVLDPDKAEIKRKVDAKECDAVLGDREEAVGTYREFVVFDAAQVYPEYLLLYARDYESS